MSQRTPPPDIDDLINELKALRRKGITRSRQLALTALRQSVHAAGRVDERRSVSEAAIHNLVRTTIADLPREEWRRTASILFGLSNDSSSIEPPALRDEAAEYLGVARKTLTNDREPKVFEQMAMAIARMCEEHQMRMAALDRERRPPTGTRLAVQWLERFETYYGLWTPIYGLANDLTAYRATLLELDRPWDREPCPEDPDAYTQEEQAAGYASYALFFYAEQLVLLERFITKFGGLWLLSDKQAETDASDAVARIRLASPFNEEDDSYLRTLYGEVEGEVCRFRAREHELPLQPLHELWQRFVSTCTCEWSGEPDRGYFVTHRSQKKVRDECQAHAIITAANDYCLIIDDEWDRLADWYHIGEPRPTGVSAETLYENLRKRTIERGVHQWPPW